MEAKALSSRPGIFGGLAGFSTKALTVASSDLEWIQACATVAAVIVALAENARIPVDNPSTHLELTMVHEAMILEYSGRHLAMIEFGAQLKLLLYVSLIICLFYPWGIGVFGAGPLAYTAGAALYDVMSDLVFATSGLDKTLPEDWDNIALHGPGSPQQTAYSKEFCPKLHAEGLLVPHWPEKFGGLGGNALDLSVVVYELSRVSTDLGMPFGGSIFCGLNVYRKGTEEQRAYWLPRLLSGERKFCIGISEPDAGSDVGAIRTTAVRDGDHYIVNGQKTWTTLGQYLEHLERRGVSCNVASFVGAATVRVHEIGYVNRPPTPAASSSSSSSPRLRGLSMSRPSWASTAGRSSRKAASIRWAN